jgi:hypothetical protein
MGALVGQKCYATVLEANVGFCAELLRAQASANGCYTYTTVCTAATATQLTLNRSSPAYTATTGCAAQAATSTNFTQANSSWPACDPLTQYTDLGVLWGLGLASLAVIWAMKSFILKLVSPH